MRKLILLLLSGTLSTACIDKDYDLGEIDTDDITIGSEESQFRIPLATVLVTKDEIKNSGGDIEAIFDEADIWLPSPLPEGAKSVNLQLLRTDPDEVGKLLDALTAQMLTDNDKLNAIADLLCEDKYIGTFLPLLPPGTNVNTFKPVFIEAFKNDAAMRETLSGAVRTEAHTYLTTLEVNQLEYEVGHIDISSDVVDMLADNLDPKGTPNAKNTLFLYGKITSGLPVSVLLDPLFSPTEIAFQVEVGADKTSNDIPETQLFAEDLRQIVEGVTIRIPVTLKEYYPGRGFSDDQHQIVISLSLLKNGGLKLDI